MSTDDSFMTIVEVCKRVSVSRATIYDWIDKGLFPRQRNLNSSSGCVRWLKSEVETWIKSRPPTRPKRS